MSASPEPGDYHPFETRDQNLFNLIHGQPLPSNAALNKKGQALWSGSLVITNTLNHGSTTNEDIYLDYEAYRFNLSYQYGLNEHWNLKLDVPVIHQGGGVFDSAIDNWHEFFGLPRANRPFVEHNQYDIQYSRQGQTLLDLDQPSTRLGDIQLSAAHSIITENDRQLSLWAGLKLPSGDKNKLSSNGATDFSAWLALNQKLAQHWLINLNAGSVIPGSSHYKDMAVSDYVFYGHVMLGWLVTEQINLKVQLQGHSSYYKNSQLAILGDIYFMTFGAAVKINRCQQIDFAINEDIKVNTSPDASLLISWRSYAPSC